jgi:hypothetical protein
MPNVFIIYEMLWNSNKMLSCVHFGFPFSTILNYGEGEDATPSHFGIRSGPQRSKLLI